MSSKRSKTQMAQVMEPRASLCLALAKKNEPATALPFASRIVSENLALSQDDFSGALSTDSSECFGYCSNCLTLLYPGPTCSVSTRRPKRLRINCPKRETKPVHFFAKCKCCGKQTRIGSGSSRMDVFISREETVDAKRLQGKQSRLNTGVKKKKHKSRNILSVESAKALGVISAFQKKSMDGKETVLERLARQGSQQSGPHTERDSTNKTAVADCKNSAKVGIRGKAQSKKLKRDFDVGKNVARTDSQISKKSTLENFLTALRK